MMSGQRWEEALPHSGGAVEIWGLHVGGSSPSPVLLRLSLDAPTVMILTGLCT